MFAQIFKGGSLLALLLSVVCLSLDATPVPALPFKEEQRVETWAGHDRYYPRNYYRSNYWYGYPGYQYYGYPNYYRYSNPNFYNYYYDRNIKRVP